MSLDFFDPTRPAPPNIDKSSIVNFSYPKTLLFKQTYHQLILFYPTRFSASSFFSSKVGNKVPILTFSFVFIINKFYIIESLILYYEIFVFTVILSC